jgi:hypothetical protein
MLSYIRTVAHKFTLSSEVGRLSTDYSDSYVVVGSISLLVFIRNVSLQNSSGRSVIILT